MTAIVVKSFNGLKPIVTPRLLDGVDAQVAQNVRLVSGALSPMKTTNTLKATTIANPATIFRYGSSATETNYWLEFTSDTDVMRSPIANDQYDRLYWTDGANRPRYGTNAMILSGSTFPGSSYELGIPKPTTQSVVSTFSITPVYNVLSRDYVLTFVNVSTGKESVPGSVFTVQAVDGQKVALSALTTDNLGDAGITKKRLYRKVNGAFKLVTELGLDVTTYDDLSTDATVAASAALPTAVGSAPPTPVRSPTLAATSASPIAAASLRSYIYTLANIADPNGGDYTESAPSPVSTASADSSQSVTLYGFTNYAGGLSGTGFNVYRKDVDSTQYLLIAALPLTQTSFVDKISSTALGHAITQYAPGNYAPSAAPGISATATTALPVVKRVYMLTFLDGQGHESSRSPSSTYVDAIDGSTSVSISHSETIPTGVTTKRVYRQTVSPVNGVYTPVEASWRLVVEVPVSSTLVTDARTDSALPATYYPTALQGLPAAPSDTPVTNATIPAKVVPESRTYIYTFVSAYGEEGPPSDASDVIDLDSEKTTSITLGGAPSGNYNITLKRIYRSSTVGNIAKFQFVAEIPVSQLTFSDTVAQADLAETLPSETWLAPPLGLKGLRLMANGAAVGFVGRTVYLSEPNLPHAWPNQYTVDEDIVGIAVFGQSVAVLTKSYPYLMSGVDPAAMTLTKLKLPQACVAKRSIVETGDGVIYASPEGLVQIGSTIGMLTLGLYSREQWQAFNPSSIECYIYNGRVLVTYATGSQRAMLVIDVSGQGATLTTTDINTATPITSGYYDAKTDLLYLAQGGNIIRFDQGGNLSMTWRSKIFRLLSAENFAVAQVRCSAYPMTFKLYADGVLKHTKSVTNGDLFRLPSGFRGLDWEFQLEGVNTITEVLIASSALELKSA